MQTNLLSGDLKDIWILQPINGGVRYVPTTAQCQLSLSLPWEYAQITELELVTKEISAADEIPETVTSSAEAENLQSLPHPFRFLCTLSDGRRFAAEVNRRDWAKWQKLAARPFKTTAPKMTQDISQTWKSTPWMTKIVVCVVIFLAWGIIGTYGEKVALAVKARLYHPSPSTIIHPKVP